MNPIRKFFLSIHNFFENHHQRMMFVSVLTMVVLGFLEYDLTYQGHDLIYWQKVFLNLRWDDMILLCLMVLIPSVLMKVISLTYTHVMNSYLALTTETLSREQVKKRYAGFILNRLVTDIETVDRKYYPTSAAASLENIMKAHAETTLDIQKFRSDARKLLRPNDVELLAPIEELYYVGDYDELDGPWYISHMEMSDVYDLVRTLAMI